MYSDSIVVSQVSTYLHFKSTIYAQIISVVVVVIVNNNLVVLISKRNKYTSPYTLTDDA